MTKTYSVKTLVGVIEVSNGNISKEAKKALEAFTKVRHLRTKETKDKDGTTWIIVYPEDNSLDSVAHFPLHKVECNLKHKPCDRKCLLKKLDFPFE